MPIGGLILFVFGVYRQIVFMVLKIKYGSKFGGLLKGSDAFHMTSESSDHVINSLLMFKCAKDFTANMLYQNMREVVQNMQQRTKFNSRFQTSFGYTYMLKDELRVDDCIKEMRIIGSRQIKLSKPEFLELLNEYCNLELPQDNTVPWEILVGQQPIYWEDDEFTYLPLLFRNQHAIADGITLLQVMVSVLSDKEENNDNSATRSEPSPFKKNIIIEHIRCAIKAALVSLYVLLLIPAACVTNFLLKGKDSNILCGPTLGKIRHFVLDFEFSSNYVSVIKEIKWRIPGTSFPDVVLTAFSASLNDYFVRKNARNEYISAAVPVLLGSSEIYKLDPKNVNIQDLEIDNKHSFLILNFPLHIKQKRTNIEEIFTRLGVIRKQTTILKKSYDYQVMMLLFNKLICTCLPRQLVRRLLKSTRCTAIVSVLPGPPKLRCWKGMASVSNVIAFTPNAYNIGTSFTFNTYDERVHIGMSVDTSLIDMEDVEEIAKSVLAHIRSLDDYLTALERCNILDEVLETYPFL
ncbi:hypothetical protein ILUMI_06376 [Ignelater luminosus]|uniref:O-acyltransferase WSD1 C-terminal domain-containing protein n=1 Tax=Ignelater luminosus TaxID=2038154 RepID=A0A8K0D8K4_IGNLU|nr:hypothetical protein ILUMI_06376 [Ignelater luminosus]